MHVTLLQFLLSINSTINILAINTNSFSSRFSHGPAWIFLNHQTNNSSTNSITVPKVISTTIYTRTHICTYTHTVCMCIHKHIPICKLPWWLSSKESTWGPGDMCSILGLGRSPGGGNGNLLQYSCLENSTSEEPVGYSPWGHKESDTTEWPSVSMIPTCICNLHILSI